MLKFHLVADPHYYPYEILGFNDRRSQTTLNEGGAVIDSAFEILIADKSTDLVLLAGDLTHDGELPAHEDFIKKLRHLQENGKRVILITASHDYDCYEDPPEGEARREGKLYRSDLYALYQEFGHQEAIAEHPNFSYVVQLAPGYRLLCLYNDGESHELRRMTDWIVEQVQKAREDGQFIFAMHHYPMLPPSPIYSVIAAGNMIKDWDAVTSLLADAGLRFVFTGHSHMTNITCKTSENGNRLYEINTGSLTGYPAPIREVVIDEESMHISTNYVERFDWDLQGKTAKQYLSDSFDRMLNAIFESAGHNAEELLNIMAVEFSANKEALMKHKLLLTLGGKFLYYITLGGAGTLLLCRRKVPKSVRKIRVKDLIIETVRNIYAGDEPYSRDTPIGTAAWVLTGRLDKLAKPFLKNANLPFDNIQSFVASLLYDDTPDAEAALPLRD